MHKLRELKVYQKSLGFTKSVRKITKTFPKQELFGLTSQFTRAADSIVLNIAEGSGNSSNKEFARFLDYAIRSGFECLGCADIALDNAFISQTDYKQLIDSANEIIAMLDGLRKRFLR